MTSGTEQHQEQRRQVQGNIKHRAASGTGQHQEQGDISTRRHQGQGDIWDRDTVSTLRHQAQGGEDEDEEKEE